MASGKSKGERSTFGERRAVSGKELAPKSLRRKGKRFMAECSDAELEKAGVK